MIQEQRCAEGEAAESAGVMEACSGSGSGSVLLPAALAVQSLTGRLREHDPLELHQLQNLQVVQYHLGVRNHIVG